MYVAIGAGHAFKFASVIGRMLADLVTTGATDHDLTPFSATRAILGRPDHSRTYMM